MAADGVGELGWRQALHEVCGLEILTGKFTRKTFTCIMV